MSLIHAMGTPYLVTCPSSVHSYVGNLTSSYMGNSNESLVVATSVAMFLLAAGFFTLTLLSRVSQSHVSSVVSPTADLFLTGAVSLFLPVMSYLFSDAKSASDCMAAAAGSQYSPAVPPAEGGGSELPPRARIILTWMLLVELLRKRVQAVKLVAKGTRRYIDIATNAATVVWLGYLVFFNIKAPGRVAMFGFFWLFCAIKLVQRVVFAELMNRSLAYDKNAHLVSSYMDHYNMIQQQDLPNASLKTCEYVVMGEEKLVLEPGPRGYRLDLRKVNDVVTISKIWRLAEDDHRHGVPLVVSSDEDRCPKRLCFSFALFKLLRRRIEPLPGAMDVEETARCRDLIFQGLCKDEAAATLLFQVLRDEVDFLSEYYHSVHPVALATPFFFVVNYLIVFLVFCILCGMITVLSGNGNVPFAVHSLKADNYVLSSGVFTLIGCLLKTIVVDTGAFFATIDVLISGLLLVSVLMEQVWEFMVFLLSKWFMVSLLCTYVGNPTRWRHNRTFRGFVRGIWRASARIGGQSPGSLITYKQLSVVLGRACWFSTLSAASLPSQAKRSIVQRFRRAAYGRRQDDAITNGPRALELERHHGYVQLAGFCDSDSIAEVILTWHIATELLDTVQASAEADRQYKKHMVVATRLSRYCAYLVAFRPELLPDHREGTKSVYEKMKKDLRETLGLGWWWGYMHCFSSKRNRCMKLMMMAPNKNGVGEGEMPGTVVQKGTVLGKKLLEQAEAGNQSGSIWEMLADLWVELIVYVAPSGSEEHVKGHEEALVQGGELVTQLWALATHTGIARRRPLVADVGRTFPVEDGICPA